MNATPIEEEDWVDAKWGDIISCESLPYSDEWPYDKGTCVPDVNPWQAMCDFRVEYGNGNKAILQARGGEILCGEGFRGAVIEGDNLVEPSEYLDREAYSQTGFRFFNVRLVATVVNALSKGEVIPRGNVTLVDNGEAMRVLSLNDMKVFPVLEDEEDETEIYQKWVNRWIEEGVCVEDKGGHGMCVSKMLLEEEKARAGEQSELTLG